MLELRYVGLYVLCILSRLKSGQVVVKYELQLVDNKK